jgi:hypothetical protein
VLVRVHLDIIRVPRAVQVLHPAAKVRVVAGLERGEPPFRGVGGGQVDRDDPAVAAYRTSINTGRPLSERKLAAMFGKTSRRWARSRMAEVRLLVKVDDGYVRLAKVGCWMRERRFLVACNGESVPARAVLSWPWPS